MNGYSICLVLPLAILRLGKEIALRGGWRQDRAPGIPHPRRERSVEFPQTVHRLRCVSARESSQELLIEAASTLLSSNIGSFRGADRAETGEWCVSVLLKSCAIPPAICSIALSRSLLNDLLLGGCSSEPPG